MGAFNIKGDKARAAGLTHRPLAEIARDTLSWYKEEFKQWPDGKRPGLTVAREQELLRALKARG